MLAPLLKGPKVILNDFSTFFGMSLFKSCSLSPPTLRWAGISDEFLKNRMWQNWCYLHRNPRVWVCLQFCFSPSPTHRNPVTKYEEPEIMHQFEPASTIRNASEWILQLVMLTRVSCMTHSHPERGRHPRKAMESRALHLVPRFSNWLNSEEFPKFWLNSLNSQNF